ncbi:glycosyltransferase [bacterium]|nr:glycosyltransferase [bacterium]
MKVCILFEMVEGPWGGGNQFIKALRNYLIENSLYVDRVSDADVILFNSHHSLERIFELREKYPEKCFIHRLDGPVSLIRNSSPIIDKYIFTTNDIVADGTIFQSNWSYQQSLLLGYQNNTPYSIIVNAPNTELFNNRRRSAFNPNEKLKIIATSWSDNMRKGFDVYRWMDDHLDFNRFSFTFIGNSPIEFKNIESLAPLASDELSMMLQKSDVFITASKSDTCSNSLIEALHCGNVALVYNDGGHPEILDSTGEKFDNVEEIPRLLEAIQKNWQDYADTFQLPNFNDVGRLYCEFMESVYKDRHRKTFPSSFQKVDWKFKKFSLQLSAYLLAIKNKLNF